MRSLFKEEMSTLTTSHVEELRRLNNEFFEAKKAMEETHDELQLQYTELKKRFTSRESRPEDLERIRKLEEMMISKNEEIKRVKEEMRYFKLELLNREENFNQKFGARPNVGVMQVIKPKNNKNGKNKSGQRRDSKSISAGLPPLQNNNGPGRPSSDSRRNNKQRAPEGGRNGGGRGAPSRRPSNRSQRPQ